MNKWELTLFKWRRKLRDKFANEQIFNSYADARQYCSANDYENDEIINLVKAKSINYRKELLQTSFPKINMGVMPILQAIQNTDGSVVIFDFGGADGIYYLQTRRCVPLSVQLIWCVIETPKMCAAMKEFETEELKFFPGIAEASNHVKRNPDIFHTSSTLQYTEDPLKYLALICNAGAKFLVFNRQSLTRGDAALVSVQTSLLSWHGQGSLPSGFTERVIQYPHTNIPQQEFERVISSNYEIIYAFEDSSGVKTVNKEPIAGTCYFCRMRS